jgi:hypothetical protein
MEHNRKTERLFAVASRHGVMNYSRRAGRRDLAKLPEK